MTKRKYKKPPSGLTAKEIMAFNVDNVTPGGCWEVRQNHQFGYGMCTIDGVRDVSHRHAWRVFNGPIPAGMKVLHKCDNPACTNPAHLFLGTDLDNLRDMTKKLRHGRMKLSPQTVHQIREMKAAGLGPVVIGRELGIPSSTVGNIFYKNSWHYV